MKKRLLTLLLATTLTLTMFTACGENKAETPNTNNNSSSDETEGIKVLTSLKSINNTGTMFNYETSYEYTFYDNGLIKTKIDKSSNRDYYTTYTYEYDENGNLIKEMREPSSADKDSETIIYEYDKYNNMIKQSNSFHSGDETTCTETNISYEYDNKGNILKSESLFGNAGAKEVVENTYDENNNLLTHSYIYYDMSGEETKRTYEKNEYDADGLLIKKFDADGAYLLYEYNEQGKEVKVSEYDADGNFIDIYRETEYTYNENGEIEKYVTHTSYSSFGDMYTGEYTYDADGDVLLVRNLDENKEVAIEVIYKYEIMNP